MPFYVDILFISFHFICIIFFSAKQLKKSSHFYYFFDKSKLHNQEFCNRTQFYVTLILKFVTCIILEIMITWMRIWHWFHLVSVSEETKLFQLYTVYVFYEVSMVNLTTEWKEIEISPDVKNQNGSTRL